MHITNAPKDLGVLANYCHQLISGSPLMKFILSHAAQEQELNLSAEAA